MHPDFAKWIKIAMNVEEDIIPVVVHNPRSQDIAMIVLMAASAALAMLGGAATSVPVVPTPTAPSAQIPAV